MSREKAKSDFIDFARSQYPQQVNSINVFAREYDVDLPQSERVKQTQKWIVKDNFFWHSIKDLPQ